LLEMGKHERSIARQAMRFGQPIPDRIANAPELRIGLQLFLQGFFDLDSERTHVNGPAPIPWTSIKAYCVANELDEEQTDDMFYFVKAMDGRHLERLAAKLKTK